MAGMRWREARRWEDIPHEGWMDAALVCARSQPGARQFAPDELRGIAYLALARAMQIWDESKGRPHALLMPIVEMQVRHERRRAGRAKRLREAVKIEPIYNAVCVEPEALTRVQVARCQAVLTQQQRRFLQMRLQELSCQEIAESLGVSVYRVHQIRRETEQRLRDAGVI